MGAALALDLAVLTAWAWQRDPGLQVWTTVGLLMCAGTAFVSAHALFGMRAVRLRWDGRAWWWSSMQAGPVDEPGEIDVALDFGAWMLLRFRPAAGLRGAARSRFIAVQRHGLEGSWHALRCSVFAQSRREEVASSEVAL